MSINEEMVNVPATQLQELIKQNNEFKRTIAVAYRFQQLILVQLFRGEWPEKFGVMQIAGIIPKFKKFLANLKKEDVQNLTQSFDNVIKYLPNHNTQSDKE